MPVIDDETNKQINDLYREINESAVDNQPKAKKPAEGFKSLPNGNYTGAVNIVLEKVSNPDSPNYSLRKFKIELTVLDGEYKGKMAYRHYVEIPHNLALAPPKTEQAKYDQWRAAVKAQLREVNKLLAKCGVDTSSPDRTLLVQKIAENNRRKPKVNFTIKEGNPYINYVINLEDDENSLFHTPIYDSLPDGNDLPLT